MRFERPGPCPLCKVFCSRRTPHECVIPEPYRDEIPLSGRSPLMAWPAHARVRRDGRVMLRSPLASVGPRLLVRLAQHRSHGRRDLPAGKRARYGPSHALNDLVEGGDALVLDEVLRPGPAWVPCSGTWHRVLLWDGELCLMAHSDIDLESERVAAAISGQPLTGCVDALDRWARRHSAVHLPWLEALAALDAAASFGVDELATWDAWIDDRLPSFVVHEAEELDIGAAELLRWTSWTRSPAWIANWRLCGWTSHEARALEALGFGWGEAMLWREAGFEVAIIDDAMQFDLTLDEVEVWFDAGFRPRSARILMDAGVTADEARRERERLGRIDLVLKPYLGRGV